MTASATAAPGAAFDTGRVIARVIETVKSQGLPLWLGAVLLVGIPQAATNFWLGRTAAALKATPGWKSAVEAFAASELQGVLVMILGSYLTAWIAVIAVSDMAGHRRRSPIEAVGQVARRALPIGIQAGMLAVGFALGTLLLIVPGIMLLVAWIVSTPALVVEGASPRRAFARSFQLTRGWRGAIFGLALSWFIPVMVVQFILEKLVTGGLPLKAANATPVVSIGLQPLLGSLLHVVLAVGIASTYLELVTIKEGGLKSSVADVFA